MARGCKFTDETRYGGDVRVRKDTQMYRHRKPPTRYQNRVSVVTVEYGIETLMVPAGEGGRGRSTKNDRRPVGSPDILFQSTVVVERKEGGKTRLRDQITSNRGFSVNLFKDGTGRTRYCDPEKTTLGRPGRKHKWKVTISRESITEYPLPSRISFHVP